MKYFVALNLNRDCKDYVPGDTIDLPEDVAADLLGWGVLSTSNEHLPPPPMKEAPPVPESEMTIDPVVGGAPVTTGEPNLDAQSAPAPVSVPATDVTPPVEDDPSANL